jgi:hypothetical protein
LAIEATDHAIDETGANVLHDKRWWAVDRKGGQHRFQRADAACGRAEHDQRRASWRQ